MKEIKAIIRPFKLDEVITELHRIDDLPGICISEIKGFGKFKSDSSSDSIREGLHDCVKKMKLEIVVHDEMVMDIVEIIQKVAHTGIPGDGKIFVLDVDDVVKVRTNEHGENAI
jgi:nitrogen regulatory protein PII